MKTEQRQTRKGEKLYCKIDQYLARHFKYNGGCLSSPPSFLCSHIITPFSNSMISVYPYSSFILEFFFVGKEKNIT